jgi:hypothetical protein
LSLLALPAGSVETGPQISVGAPTAPAGPTSRHFRQNIDISPHEDETTLRPIMAGQKLDLMIAIAAWHGPAGSA